MNNKYLSKFCDFVCSIKSVWFKFIALTLIFGTLFGMTFIIDDNIFSFKTFLGIMLASFGYGIALALALIRYQRGIKD